MDELNKGDKKNMEWEYKIWSDMGGDREETFNKFGKEGWELVCLDSITIEYIFKRRIK